MYSSYEVCKKRTYDTIGQLMKLTDENDPEGFFKLVKKNKRMLLSGDAFALTAVLIGLIARNSVSILDGFLKKIKETIGASVHTKVMSTFIGTLIMENKCTEAVICFIENGTEMFGINFYNILDAALTSDNLPVFMSLNNLEKSRYLSDSMYARTLFVCGVFKNRKILDHITNGGRKLLKKEWDQKYDFRGLFPYQDPTYENLKRETDEDPSLTWIRNIYSMYICGSNYDDAYEILFNITKNTGLIYDEKKLLVPFFGSIDTFNELYMREAEIMLLCGHKTNDVTKVVKMLCVNDLRKEHIILDFVNKIASNKPFVNYSFTNNIHLSADAVAKIADRLNVTLTVRLINGFDFETVKELLGHGNISLEIDLENEETLDHFKEYFTAKSCSELYWRKGYEVKNQKQKWDMLKFLIDGGFASMEKLSELIVPMKDPELLKVIFNYTRQ